MPLNLFYTMVQKSQKSKVKNDQKLKWRFSQTFSLALQSTTEFFFFTQRRPEFPGRNVVFNKTIAGRRRTLLLTQIKGGGPAVKWEKCP